MNVSAMRHPQFVRTRRSFGRGSFGGFGDARRITERTQNHRGTQIRERTQNHGRTQISEARKTVRVSASLKAER
jgi:hypothetical protein